MKMTGEERVPAPPSRVWQALNDARILQQCIPGCQSLEQEGADRLRAIVEIKIGPIGARFNSTVTLTNIQPLQGYTLTGEGQGGTVGSAKATIHVRLNGDGMATRVVYDVDAQVGGRLAQLGGPIIDATAKQFAAKFFRRFGEVVGGAAEVPPAAASHDMQRGASIAPGAVAAPIAAAQTSDAFPYAWILAVVVAALAGFLAGRGENGVGSEWMGLAIGLLILIVGAAGVEYGRRIAAPQIVIDAASLARLLRGERQ